MYSLGRMHIRAHKGKTFAYKDKVGGVFANAEARLGYNFKTEGSVYLTPFVGLGLYHTRPMKAVHYTQNWSYAAVGIKADYDVGSRLNIGVNVKGTRALHLEQRFKKHKHTVSHHKTSDVLGYALSLPITAHLGSAQSWDMRAEPYYLKLNSHSDANVVGGQLALSAKY